MLLLTLLYKLNDLCLLLRLEGDPHWWEPPWHKKLPAAKNFKLNSREFEEIMYDNTWTKAVFFRDPSRRSVIGSDV